jgi:hypothetical protein
MHREKNPSIGRADGLDRFLHELRSTPNLRAVAQRGRLIFALDATASREPTWEQARRVQARMFEVAGTLGGLEVQLCWYRGFEEFDACGWFRDAESLRVAMERISCRSGHTQIERVFRHTVNEGKRAGVNALVFIGDALEEPAEPLYALATQFALRGTPAFLFQEGDSPQVGPVFREIARISGGACIRFDHDSPTRLAALLQGVAAFAAGGMDALRELARRQAGATREMIHQLQKRP